jgi:hypothetical protein
MIKHVIIHKIGRYCDAFAFAAGPRSERFSMDQHGVADESLSAPGEPHALLMVHDSIAGMRTYLSVGVSTLVAVMVAHRIAASKVTRKPAALQNEIDRIRAALTTRRSAGEWRG